LQDPNENLDSGNLYEGLGGRTYDEMPVILEETLI